MGPPVVMYAIIRKSLKMNAGKVGAQVGHAVMMACELSKLDVPEDKRAAYNTWLAADYPKIVLAATDDEFAAVRALPMGTFIVFDRGYTQVPAMSETCIGLWPMRKDEAPRLIQKLPPLR